MNGRTSQPPVDRLGDLARHQAARIPTAEALVCGRQRLDYEALAGLVDRCAAALLTAGVERGDAVAVLSTPRWEQVVVFLACSRLGVLFVGLNPRHRHDELRFVLQDAMPRVLMWQSAGRRDLTAVVDGLRREATSVQQWVVIGGRSHGAVTFERFLDGGSPIGHEALERACAGVAASDPVAVVYTSGSTGTRKGALLTSSSLLWTFWAANSDLDLTTPVRCLNDLPIDHLGGLVERVLPPLLTGGSVVIHPRFDPDAFLADAAAHRVTYLQAEVTQWLRCVALDAFDSTDLSSVEVALYTGAAAPRPLLRRLTAKFPRVATAWGMSETSGAVTFADRVACESAPGLVGIPLRGVELRIADEGRILPGDTPGTIHVRGRPVFAGYLGRPQATREVLDADGWLDTGDRGMLLADGSLRLLGRNSDMYKSGGYNIYPREVEAVIETHPSVAHVAVTAVEHPLFQEVGAAFVVARADAQVDMVELALFCRDRMADYKVPKTFRLLPDLPVLANGKVDKRALRQLHEEDVAKGAVVERT